MDRRTNQTIRRNCIARPGERRRWEKKWHIVLDNEGKQSTMKQRPDFREAKQAHRQLYKEHAESTDEGINSIHPAHQDKIIDKNSKVPKSTTMRSTLELDGNITLRIQTEGRTPRTRAVSHGMKPMARRVQGRSFITTSCREPISQQAPQYPKHTAAQ